MSHLHRGGSLKSRISLLFLMQIQYLRTEIRFVMKTDGVYYTNTGGDGDKWRLESAGNEEYQVRYIKHEMEKAVGEE
jgi:hypothetical protein